MARDSETIRKEAADWIGGHAAPEYKAAKMGQLNLEVVLDLRDQLEAIIKLATKTKKKAKAKEPAP